MVTISSLTSNNHGIEFLICDGHRGLDGLFTIGNLFNRMTDIAADFIRYGHWILIVGVISGEKDLNLRMLIEEEAKVFATTFSFIACRTENQGNLSSLMGFNNRNQFFQTITIVGIVDEDLGSIFLSENFHTSRNAGCSDPFFDVLQTCT